MEYCNDPLHRARQLHGERRQDGGELGWFGLCGGNDSVVEGMDAGDSKCRTHSLLLKSVIVCAPKDEEEVIFGNCVLVLILKLGDRRLPFLFHFAKHTTSRPCSACVQCGGYTRTMMLCRMQNWRNSSE